MRSFIAELRRRNVFRSGALYAAGVWALAQGIAQLGPSIGFPDWVTRWFLVAAVIGFPFWIAFAWFYEFTPEGLKRESEIDPAESITAHTGKTLDRWIISILAVAVVLLLTNTFVWHKGAGLDAGTGSTSAADKSIAVKVPDKSIAVLPFENLSSDKSNAYFATGMQDEILTRLAGIHDLMVISRTSTEQYASHPPNLKIVAEQLGVAAVLEGSVQKADSKVRINLQLIDARSDSHLWAQNYDRDIKDVFAVQSDVAQSVADALKAQLLPAESERIASVPTQDPGAHDLFLRANSYLNRANDEAALILKELPLAIGLYEQALAKDPKFALAAAGAAEAHMLIYWFGPDRSPARLASAKAKAEQALALQPNLPEAHVAMALYWYWGHRDYAQGLQELDMARKARPNDSQVEVYLGAIARRQGRFDDALAHFQRAIELDPRNSVAFNTLAYSYNHLRRYAEADRAFEQAATFSHEPADQLVSRAADNTLAWKGDLEALRSALAALTPGANDYQGNASSFYLLAWLKRDYAAAARAAESDTANDWADQNNNVVLPRRLHLAWAYEAHGDKDKANALYTELRQEIQATLQSRPDDPDLHLALGFAAAGLGLREEAIREGRRCVELVPPSRDRLSGPGYGAWFAKLLVRAGERDQAIEILRKLMADPYGGGAVSPALLGLDPVWDPLRSDPRFVKLLTDGEAAMKAQAATTQ
jgi:TolB-like protein/tetratricopeptide (TPR) repeat protein